MTEFDPNAKLPEDAVVLTGFLGHSPKDGQWRLYLTPELNDFLEIQAEDILYAIMPEEEQSAATLWVKPDAALERTQTSVQQVQAEFLSGDIMSGFLDSTSHTHNLAGEGPHIESTVICQTVMVSVTRCPTVRACPPPTPLCISESFCPTERCPTEKDNCTRACPTERGCP
ncbi:hypothetical protein EV586_102634 [Tumebacillus sp. BK434]|uniref:hypothetical protein n=1 Tax=Tumebacillus sp. BK434 TaxID=2512169 RepID=UPI00105262B1|nr:hypothetical protein [Tumebacillus sp. BK434]TCP58181.1 hypothetical protein EV586_102634 [Tumebacillus sp. BK434]